MDLKEIGTNTRNWVDLPQDWGYWRVILNAAFNLRVPYAMEQVKNTKRKETLRPRLRWEDNIRMDLEENAENWVDSGQDKDYWRSLVNAALNPRVP